MWIHHLPYVNASDQETPLEVVLYKYFQLPLRSLYTLHPFKQAGHCAIGCSLLSQSSPLPVHLSIDNIIWSVYSSIHSFIQVISIVPLPVLYYSEALPAQHEYCVGISCRSGTGNCELKTCPRSIHGGWSGSRTHDPSDERRLLYQTATTSNNIMAKLAKGCTGS